MFGFFLSLVIYNPVTGEIHNQLLFHLTPTGASFLGTAILYALLCQIPGVRRYVRKDIGVSPDYKPFDRKRIPPKQNLFFMPVIWLGCWIITKRAKLKIQHGDKRGIKPPFLVLGTHQSFTDFYVSPLALFPHRANYISELEGFEYYGEWGYRQIGCLGTRKFVDDLALVKNIKRVVDRGDIMVYYPEARYANVGTSSKLPRSVAKLIKLLKVPVVILNMKGNYLQSPIWNLKCRKEVRLHTDVTYALTKDEVAEKSVDEIYEIVSKLLTYDEYAWQREQNMEITMKDRAEGLHMPLYQCIQCGKEFKMTTKDATLTCECCGGTYEMDTLGTLQLKKAGKPDAKKSIYIPDWYEWERKNVEAEIDANKYGLAMKIRIEALPNAKNFIPYGEGYLVHDLDGYRLTFTDPVEKKEVTLTFPPASMISLHTEYNYRGNGQCITLSTVDNTYFIYPLEEGFNATKLQFATEYLNERTKKNHK